MKPEKDLDSLVCEKVMGWRSYGTSWLTGSTEVLAGSFKPSTNHDHAKEVVERMSKLGQNIYKRFLDNLPNFSVVPVTHGQPIPDIWDTISAEDICHAALLALDVKV